MSCFIDWCNANQGFLSAILSLISIFLSIIAIYVAIKTMRLPYFRKIKLGSTFNYPTIDNKLSNNPISYSITATNCGNRDVIIKYLGFGYYVNGELIKMVKINQVPFKSQQLSQGGVIETIYSPLDIYSLRRDKLYLLAIDSEGKKYKKKVNLNLEKKYAR